ncbi:MAG TPA: hypothetical protein ENJ27_01670 [Candidatus Moranbacteria bacterium]|nr:hypothetical protein [Candidatus Moranbacteria bacterium]
MITRNIKEQMPQLELSTKKEKIEKEKFEPKIIFDFIRHGQAEYGTDIAEKMSSMGYEFKDYLPTSKISDKEMTKREIWEGRITTEGRKQLEQVVDRFIKKIDKDKEVLIILSGPRFRQEQSGEIILNELEKNNINVFKAREHKDLVDSKKHWISILEFVKDKTKKDDSPWQYWLKMSENELKEADLEGFNDIGKRMDHFMRLLKRYAQRYQKQLGLDKKVLRIISSTSDINILSLLQKDKLSDLEQEVIKNAEIVELGVDEDGEVKLIT